MTKWEGWVMGQGGAAKADRGWVMRRDGGWGFHFCSDKT